MSQKQHISNFGRLQYSYSLGSVMSVKGLEDIMSNARASRVMDEWQETRMCEQTNVISPISFAAHQLVLRPIEICDSMSSSTPLG